MTVTKEPQVDPTPDPHEPHGIVEEIREEIGHVVEHVPKPVRWTVRKLVLAIGLGLAGLVLLTVAAVLLYFANRTELLAKELVLFVNGTLASRTDVALEFDDIHGNPLREVKLVRPRVHFRDGDGPVLLEAPSIRLRYSPWALVTGNHRAIDIDVDRPVFRVGRRGDGTLRLPVWRASGKAPRRGASAFDVRLRVHGGALDAPEPLGDLAGLDLDAGIALASGTRVQVGNLSWKHGFYDTRDLRLRGEMTAGDTVRFTIERVTTPDFALRARGGWKKGTRDRSIHAEVDHLRWQWLAGVTKNRTLEVPGEGSAVVEARGDTAWRGTFRASLVWNGTPAQGDGGFTWSARRLVLDPLRAESPAGDLSGDLAWSKLGWHLRGAVEDADPAQWSAIGITGWPEGRLQGTMRYAVDTRRAPVARLESALGPSELAGWTVDQAQVVVDFPAVGPDSFTVIADRRGGRMRLAGASAAGGWRGVYVAENLPLEEWPDGRASGLRGTLEKAEGTVAGENGKLLVTGALSGRSSDWLGAHMARWTLPDVHGVLLPKPDLEMKADLQGMDYLGIAFDSTRLEMRLLDQEAELLSVTGWASDTVVTLAGRATFGPAAWRMTLDRAEAKSRRFDWIADAPVALSGDKLGVVFDRLHARDRDATIEVAGRWATPGVGRYDWRLHALGLDLARLGLPDTLALEGRLDADLVVKGVSGDPRFEFDGAFSRPGFQGHRADSLSLALAGAPGRLEVNRLLYRLGDGALTGRLAFDGTAEPWPATLAPEAVERWLARASRWNGNAKVERFPLAELERVTPAGKGWSGTLSGEVDIAGSPERPVLDAHADAKTLAWEGYLFDDVGTRVEYRPGRLDVREVKLTRGNLVSTATGTLPLELRLGAKPVVPEAPMTWNVEIPNGDLAVLPLFVPQFGSAAGKFELHATVSGTPKHPDLNGTLAIRDGELRMAGREETLDHVGARFTLDESRITLDSLSARQGEHGRVSAHGAVELGATGFKSYAFDVDLRDFTALETGLYAAQFDGRFRVTDGERVDKQILPHVEGRADVRRAVILFDFANQTEMQKIAATTAPLFWTYKIQVNANNNLHWQPPDGDIEFNADLNLEQRLDQLIIYGEMHSVRGYYWFLSNKFNVGQADLTFDNVEGVNPVVDAQATTRIRPAGLQSETAVSTTTTPASAESHDITVHITGRADEPVIDFASSPSDLDESEILRELTLIAPVTAGKGVNVGALGDPVDNYLTRAINKTLSAEMSRVFQGYVSEWEIQRESGGIWGGTGDVYLSVGSQLTPQAFVRYRQRLPGLGHETPTSAVSTNPFERDVEAEFRLNRFFYITSEVTQRRALGGSTTTTTSGGADFNLNLKARWEY